MVARATVTPALVALVLLLPTTMPGVVRAQTTRPAPAARRLPPRPAARTGVPWWADSAHWGANVVRWTIIDRAPFTVAAGDTVRIAAPLIPAALPDSLRRRPVRWTVEPTGGATISTPTVVGALDAAPSGGSPAATLFVARAPGTARIVARTAAGLTRTLVTVHPALRGRVLAAATADGGRDSVRARLIARWADADGAHHVDTITTTAGGRFSRPLPTLPTDATVALWIEPADSATYRPAVRTVAASALHATGVVLLPRWWTIRGGDFDGAVVPIDPARALGFWRTVHGTADTTTDGAVDHAPPLGWADDDVRSVAFDPGAHLTTTDSAHFWATADALGARWGRPLFRPAASDAAEIVVTVDPRIVTTAVTTFGYAAEGAATGVLASATITLRAAVVADDRRVVAHELLHALGFGHTRSWASVMAPAGAVVAPTREDVAYGQLFEAVRRQTRRLDPAPATP